LHAKSFRGICIKSTNEQTKRIRKQLISFAHVKKFSQNIKLKGRVLTPNPPRLAYALSSQGKSPPCLRPCHNMPCPSHFIFRFRNILVSHQAVSHTFYKKIALVLVCILLLFLTTYFIEQTSTIHSVDTELIYAVLKLSFSKQYKIQCFNPLCQGFSNFFVLRPHFEKRFFYAAPLMDSLDVNDTFERLITNLKKHFCQWRNLSNAYNPRK